MLLVTLCLARTVPAQAACAAPGWTIEPIGPDTWRVHAGVGEVSADNRGRVSNLLLHRDGGRAWLLGSGPTPAAARGLACQVRAQLKLRVTDVIAPWARPELVLGVAGLRGARHWAHADVADAMRRQCPGCVERLRRRMGPAAVDLGPRPVRLPERLLRGDQGRLGPWQWRRLGRAEGVVVTAWWLADGTAAAHGLLWADGPPDGRDADLASLARSTGALSDWPATRWLPEQGPWLAADAPRQQAAYWQLLRSAAEAAVARGQAQTDAAPPALPASLPQAWATHPRHALNWQRAWRQAEDRAFDDPAPAGR